MLSRKKTIERIKAALRVLEIEEADEVQFSINHRPKWGFKDSPRAQILIYDLENFALILYGNARYSSIDHEMCHFKLVRMGIPFAGYENVDRIFYRDSGVRFALARISEWYTNNLHKRYFYDDGRASLSFYDTVDQELLRELPPLPVDSFSVEEIEEIVTIAKKNYNLYYRYGELEAKRSDES